MNDFQERMDSFKDESRRICDQGRNNCCHDDDYCFDYENDSCDRRPNNCNCNEDSTDYQNDDSCNSNNNCNCRGNGSCHCRGNCQRQIDDCETNCGDWIPESWGCGCEIPLPPLPPEPEDCCYNNRCNHGCGNYNYYDSGLFNLYNNQKVAMAYVPRIYFNSKKDIYNLDKALERGTLFRELDKPFKGGQCR